MRKVVVVTGGGAGVGRATAAEFARQGCDVGVIGRDLPRLKAAVSELQRLGAHACYAQADVADAQAVEAAAETIEAELGPIDIWVNNAMATIFAPVSAVAAEEFRRATEVTYLGTVHGTMTALKCMKRRGMGTIVNVGSALAYRSVPLQSAYCGAKSAIRGFTDSLRSELIHDRSDIRLSMVHLPAINTPQFTWALNKTGRRARPVPPIYAPEVAARAIVFAAFHPRREVWVGFPTVIAIMANRIAAGVADRYLAEAGYSSQLLHEVSLADAPANLFHPVPGEYGARGRFTGRERHKTGEVFFGIHKGAVITALLILGVGILQACLGARKPSSVRRSLSK
jgi:NAD(P)-dependent dehydrogenase (short-subunit alcohol dehydrogenase family)